jgi:hypothetical protein
MRVGIYFFSLLLVLNYFASIYLSYNEGDKENAFYLACLACICVFADRLKLVIEYIKNFKFNK